VIERQKRTRQHPRAKRPRTDTSTIFERLQEPRHNLSATQRRLASYLLADYKAAAFATAAEIARRLKISEASVVRFAANFGYRGFPELQQALRERVLQELTTLERLRDYHLDMDGRRADILATIIRYESGNIARLLQANRADAVRSWGSALQSARRVTVYGAQASAPMAQFLAFHLHKGRSGVQCFETPDIVAYHAITGMSRQDVVCVISFPRYPRALVDLARFAHERGLRVLILTDSEVSPLAAIGRPTLVAPTTPLTFVDGYAAAMCVMTAVLTQFAGMAMSSVRRSLAEYERVARRTEVFLQP
jgi:DNA-binding MurR/RpiR family transcriptional regulator